MRACKNNEVVKKAGVAKGGGEKVGVAKRGVAITFEKIFGVAKKGVAISFLIFWGVAKKSWRKKKTMGQTQTPEGITKMDNEAPGYTMF